MVDVDGVVFGLCKLMKDSDTTSRSCGSREHRQAELLLRHCLRAGECKEDAAGEDFLECFCVEFSVADEGVSQGTFMLCESRRVEDYQVVAAVDVVEKSERVLLEGLVARVAGEVEFDVGSGELDSFW